LAGISAAICSNLPYNVGTELLVRWLHYAADKDAPIKITSMTLMFQREVAERIVARVGDRQYGRLAVLTSLVADSKILFNVPNTAFFPAPNVQSSVVRIIPNADKIRALRGLDKTEQLTAKLFGQRRKMIRGIMPNVDWAAFGLTGAERAEELPPDKFTELANAL
jgi:16S rRNA (adenine1518-N6/adenine1519-N6)-dimethyltransferase